MDDPEFDYDLAVLLLNLSLESYRGSEPLNEEFEGLKKIAYINDKKTDTQLILLKDLDTNDIYISFRGTSSIHDLFTEVLAFKQKYPEENNPSKLWPTKVHKGTLTAYLSVKAKIFKEIKKIMKKSSVSKIYTTGHSLGGAMATYCAFDLKLANPDIELIMYNFGSIRTGNFSFARKFNNLVPNTYRIVNNEDFSARYPKFLYKHVGKLVFMSRNKLRVNPTRFFQFLENLDNPIGIATGQAMFDHAADKYRIVMKDMKVIEKGKLYSKKGK